MRGQEEYNLSLAVSKYLQLQHPKVWFRFDMAGSNLSKAQAGKNKAIQKGKAYPDLHILKGNPTREGYSNGLFIELKAEGTRLTKMDGSWINDHIKEQAEMLTWLNNNGYTAYFGVGFSKTKQIIDEYLKG